MNIFFKKTSICGLQEIYFRCKDRLEGKNEKNKKKIFHVNKNLRNLE